MAVLFGVDDDGKAIGIGNAKEACFSIENKINDSLSPVPDYSLSVNDRTGVITLTVREGLSKPCLYRAKVYRRSDAASIEADRLELRRLVLEGQDLTFDALPSRESELSFSLLESWMQDVLGVETLSDDIRRTLELMDDKGSYTVAGELLADADGFPGVDIARFGDSIGIFLDRETLTHCSILGQYDAALALFGKRCKYERVEGSTRNTYELVPESAFHEALANALAHRTWDVDANARVAMCQDRVEITSP